MSTTEISKGARGAVKKAARAISVLDACNQAAGFDRHAFQIEADPYIQEAIDTVAEPLRREVHEVRTELARYKADLTRCRERCAELETKCANFEILKSILREVAPIAHDEYVRHVHKNTLSRLNEALKIK